MKILIKILPVVLLMVACGGNSDESIKKQILEKKQDVIKIEQEIAALNKQLSDTLEASTNMPVVIKEMQGEEFNHYFVVFGSVEADKYGIISPEVDGKIKSIHVSEGQVVKSGALLLTLKADAIEKRVAGIKSALEMAQISFNKQESLWNQKVGSEIQYLKAKSTKEGLESQLETLESQIRMFQIRAPYSGTVNKIYSKVGEMAGAGMPVIEFVNLSKMTVKANVSEKYIGKVNVGQVVELRFSSLPNYIAKTKIVRVSKVVNIKSRTFEIELKINNTNEKIIPNMVSTIRVNDFSANDALVVSSLAIRSDISGKYVYVVNSKDNKNIVSKKYVKIGFSYNEKTMITSGLSKGDKVVVEGYNLVSTGISVDIK